MSIKSKLKVASSPIHGKGLFSTTKIANGTLLGTCKTRPTLKPTDHTLWLTRGPVNVTCKLKYINHSETPNVAYYDDLTVMALQDIAQGEELTHDYHQE